MPTARLTQTVVEVLERSFSQGRVTQTLVEVLARSFSQGRVTQTVVETLESLTTTTSTSTSTSTTIPEAQVQKGLGYVVLSVPYGAVVRKGLGFVVLQYTTTTSTSTTSTTAPPYVIEDVVIDLDLSTTSTTTTSTTSTTIDYVEDVVITAPTTTTTTSTTGPPPVGTTTTSTTTTSTTVTSTTVTTTTVTSTTTGPPIGVEWGEQYPPESIDKYAWSEWKDSDGNAAKYSPVSGSNKGWGCLILFPYQEVFSSVKVIPSGWKTLTVQKNRYGDYCCGSSQYVNIWIRGDTSTFDWDDASRSWSLYTSPVYAEWTYVQLKAKMSVTGTTTTTVTTSSSTTSTT